VNDEPTLPSPELRALALFADALANRERRRAFNGDTLGLLEDALSTKGLTLDSLDNQVREAYIDLFADMTFQEVRILARMQAKLVALDPDGALGLTEQVEVGSHVTIGKF
jgi:hypothetical protein